MFTSLMRALIAALVVVLPAAVRAQAYPAKPIRLIVPFSPGGTNDILARMVGTHLSQAWGESVIEIKTPDEMRKIIPAEIAKWTKVAIDARMPRDVN